MRNMPPDPFRDRVLLGFRAGKKAAVARARKTNTLLVIWQDGKVVHVTPDEFEQLHPDITKEK